jgi:hypothetical protein
MELFFFGFTLWLGAYLLARNSQKVTVQLTGWGLTASAAAEVPASPKILSHSIKT